VNLLLIVNVQQELRSAVVVHFFNEKYPQGCRMMFKQGGACADQEKP
jgi:hypothetical protein